MTGPILILLVCYALLGLLLAALLFRSGQPAWLKTGAVLAVGVFGVLAYDGLTGLLGWPGPQRLPERFVYHASVVVPPNRTTGEKGAIFLWATALGAEGPAPMPRAYVLPWDKDTSSSVTEAQRRVRAGIVQMGAALAEEQRGGDSTLSRLVGTQPLQRLQLTDLPEPSLPEK